MLFLFALLVIIGFALRVLTPTERGRLQDAIVARLHRAKDEAVRRHSEANPFRDALRARTPLLIVTPALLALNALVFLFMLFGSGALSNPETLVSWGGNFGPRTTNGEWWRLVTSTFVHAGLLHFLINVTGLAQVGMLLERLLGRLPVAAVYVIAGMFASLDNVSSSPIAVSVGATGAVLGVYGLLFATLMWTFLERSKGEGIQLSGLRDLITRAEPAETQATVDTAEMPASEDENPRVVIPFEALKQLAPAAVIFLIYSFNDGVSTSELSGLLAGCICGVVFAKGSVERHTPVLHVAAAAGTALVVIAGSALFVRGIADVRPEIARVVALEDRTVSTYDKAVDQFKNGTLSAKALAQVIDRKIVPELREAQVRLKAVNGVPAAHKPIVANAEEYLRLRDESWRLRADALNKSNMMGLRAADKSERASLEAYERIKQTNFQQ
jgi:membrane associated rhomboid family serine protease